MQSAAKNVTDYLKEVPDERRECLTALRSLCLEVLTGYEEAIEYGMPCYRKGENPEVAFASQKNHISLYIMKAGVINANRELLKGLNCGKGCIRYNRPDKVDLNVVQKLLMDTFNSQEEPC